MIQKMKNYGKSQLNTSGKAWQNENVELWNGRFKYRGKGKRNKRWNGSCLASREFFQNEEENEERTV